MTNSDFYIIIDQVQKQTQKDAKHGTKFCINVKVDIY